MDLSVIKLLTQHYMGAGVDACSDEEYVDRLEELLEKANQAARDGNEIMPDSIYDTCMEYLRILRPDSPILHQVWSGDDPTVEYDTDIDKFLGTNPMLSIQTIKDINDAGVTRFLSLLPNGTPEYDFHLSMKENGHGIRVVYYDGILTKATSRGRSTNGRDLTEQLKLILGEENKALEGKGLVELRGEVLLPFSNFDKAKEYNPTIKSAFSGVSSMLRDSATPEETKLLHFVGYDIMSDALAFNTLSEKYECIKQFGFEIPLYYKMTASKDNFCTLVEQKIDEIAERTKDYDYYTDGIVLSVNNLAVFDAMGSEDKYRNGNLAFKIRRWKQDFYVGRVKEIKWKGGKNRLTPVCVVEDATTGELGVMTATGNRVQNVPVYAPCYLLKLSAYPGNLIHFKYGGEAGVVPCTPTGLLITGKNDMTFETDEAVDEE